MHTQELGDTWRWRDAVMTGVVLSVPITGLLAAPRLPGLAWLAMCVLVGATVGALLSMPLTNFEARTTKVASARRVVEAVATAAVGLVAAALLGIGEHSWVSAVSSLALLWVALSISVTERPIANFQASAAVTHPTWLPIHPPKPIAAFGKRCFDIVTSLVTLLVASPIFVITALAIKLDDGGPIFFRQQRVGHNGVPFEMLKFRSMVLDAETLRADLERDSDRSGPLFKMTNDPRITAVGRYIRELSIDELPQLINILRGDMSVVGPRPALLDEERQFDSGLRRRACVVPGLTGLWQAEARSDPDFARFRELDLRYVATASPKLDLWIIAATATDILVAAAMLPLQAMGLAGNRNDGIRSTDDKPPTGPGDQPLAA